MKSMKSRRRRKEDRRKPYTTGREGGAASGGLEGIFTTAGGSEEKERVLRRKAGASEGRASAAGFRTDSAEIALAAGASMATSTAKSEGIARRVRTKGGRESGLLAGEIGEGEVGVSATRGGEGGRGTGSGWALRGDGDFATGSGGRGLSGGCIDRGEGILAARCDEKERGHSQNNSLFCSMVMSSQSQTAYVWRGSAGRGCRRERSPCGPARTSDPSAAPSGPAPAISSPCPQRHTQFPFHLHTSRESRERERERIALDGEDELA